MFKKFITFEGIDGSGKSTILKLLYNKLKTNNYKVVKTFEPTDSYIGKFVQKCINDDYDPYLTSFAFIADRIDHCRRIQRWLDEDNIVLCDRYADSTYAYQSVQLENLIKDPIKWLKEMSENLILKPDITFLFIIDPEKAMDRIKNRDKKISFEKISFLKKVNKYYDELSNCNRFIKIDANKSIDELLDICYNYIV